MELALITKFTFIDGLSLILSVLGVILYGTIIYALLFKKNSIHQEKIVLFFGITIFLYFFGNFIAFFAIALAQDYFTNAYKTGWIINLIGLSFLPASLLHSFLAYKDYKNNNKINPFIYAVLHILSFYFLHRFIGNTDNYDVLPWPVLTSNITPFQFKLFSFWLAFCTALSGFINFLLKGNQRWKRFDNYFPINGVFLIFSSIIVAIILPLHPWTPEIAPLIRLLFLFMAFIPGTTLGYYLVRYQFLNVLIKPTILYSILTALVIIVYQFGIQNMTSYLSNYEMINVDMVKIILMISLVFLFHPVRMYLLRKMNQYFFQDNEKYKTTIHNISQSLKQISDLKEIENMLLKGLGQSLHIKNIKIISNTYNVEKDILNNYLNPIVHKELVNKDLYDWMIKNDVDLIGKIKDSDDLIAILGIKLKSYKYEFNSNEIHLLNTILNQLALTLKNFKLVESRIALEKAIISQEKLSTLGQISASISHEVKNPLHSIYTLIQVMEEEEPNGKELKKDLKTIRSEIEDLSEILNEILRYANPKDQSKYISTKLNTVINKTIRLVIKEAQNYGIDIFFKPKKEIMISSIPTKLKEIIFNLILNGIQACKNKGKLIKIKTYENNNEVQVIIADDGPGIGDINDLFKPFYTTKKDGTGLGLSIVKSKVEELNGNISVKNGKLGGAEFKITLPKEINVEFN